MTENALQPQKLEHFPNSFFASVMGLAGLTLALQKTEHVAQLKYHFSTGVLYIALAVFAAIIAVYSVKALRHPAEVIAEWNHPVRMAFFPAISIGMLLLGTALRPVNGDLAFVLWFVGMVAQGGLTLAILSSWISNRKFQTPHITPAWFIPAVGNVVVPVAGVGFGYTDVSWLFFATGVLFWIILLTLVFNRLIFHDPLPARLYPTLAILIAPPGVSFAAWLQLNGGVLDAGAHIFYGLTLLFLALVTIQARAFSKLPFALSWWALSFPIAAATISTMGFAEISQKAGYITFGWLLLAALCCIIAGLIVRTVIGMIRGEICQPE